MGQKVSVICPRSQSQEGADYNRFPASSLNPKDWELSTKHSGLSRRGSDPEYVSWGAGICDSGMSGKLIVYVCGVLLATWSLMREPSFDLLLKSWPLEPVTSVGRPQERGRGKVRKSQCMREKGGYRKWGMKRQKRKTDV